MFFTFFFYPHLAYQFGQQMIKKVKTGYQVLSETGRPMGTYRTRDEAKQRLRQIEYFRHKA